MKFASRHQKCYPIYRGEIFMDISQLYKIKNDASKNAKEDAEKIIFERIRDILNGKKENFYDMVELELTDRETELSNIISYNYKIDESKLKNILPSDFNDCYNFIYKTEYNSSIKFFDQNYLCEKLGKIDAEKALKEKGDIDKISPIIASYGFSCLDKVKYYYSLGYNKYRYEKIKNKVLDDKPEDSITIQFEFNNSEKLRDNIIVSLLGEKPKLDSKYEDIYKYFSELENRKNDINCYMDEFYSGLCYGIGLGSSKALNKQVSSGQIPSHISKMPDDELENQNKSKSEWFNNGLSEGFCRGWNDYVNSAIQALSYNEKSESDYEIVELNDKVEELYDLRAKLLKKIEANKENSTSTSVVSIEEIPENEIVNIEEEIHNIKK